MFTISSAETGGLPVYTWVPPSELESGARDQIIDCARHPRAFHHIAIMPDCHQGYGMPIGGVVSLLDSISPAMVGVDIGCGMGVVRTTLKTNTLWWHSRKDLFGNQVMELLSSLVPVGEGKYMNQPHAWDGFSQYEDAVELIPEWWTPKVWSRAKHSLGTLGGGNHFLELQEGDDGHVYLMLHSGSRGLGYAIASHYQKVAAATCTDAPEGIPDLPVDSEEGQSYIRDMNFALDYAAMNRQIMMEQFVWAFYQCLSPYIREKVHITDEVNIHHNYASLEFHWGKDVWVHRKGATAAREYCLGIIPGSMGTSSYIVAGKGNTHSFRSCSHGAGRVKGRMAATRELDATEEARKVEGILVGGFGTVKRGKLKGRLDLGEAVGAYKDIDTVIDYQRDLVDVVVKLKPVKVLKG